MPSGHLPVAQQRVYRWLMKKKLFGFFGAEIVTVLAVMMTFKLIESRVHAGLIAGTFFISLGLLIVGNGFKYSSLRKTATFYLGCIHLFGVALPMVGTRLLNLSADFSDVRIWGLPGPIFHKVSTWIFMAMMLTTLAEALLSLRNKKASL